jgi:2-polyprenyl-3-methyl-5-hydroxy-6-metoxy-1,4-benzoquinol methylase
VSRADRRQAADRVSGGTALAPPLRDPVPTGNTYDKYGSSNPVVKRLMVGFESDMFELLDHAAPDSILDVGCGEGVLTEQWADRTQGRVVGIDLDDPKLRHEWERRARPNLTFHAGDGHSLPFADGEFEAATAMEVLEHVPDPAAVLAEMARVASRWLLVSVPREPLWRALNLARGAYVRELGNTPGHLNHWSKRRFAALLRQYGEVVELRSPLPWTMALVRVGS